MINKDNGFTLIEVVVVVCIIGIITSIAMLNYRHIVFKTQAAEISRALHVIEDGIIAAIIDGRTLDDFGKGHTDAANLGNSMLASYLSLNHFTQVPDGINLSVSTAATGGTPDKFQVLVMVKGESGTERILEELEKMFPRTLNHLGNLEFVVIDSSQLAVNPKST